MPQPDTVIRFTSAYAWMLIGFGALFIVLGLMSFGHNVPLGVLVVVLSVAAIIGGNYWRQHLPVMVRMTPRQLHLPRGVVIEWTNIAEVKKFRVPLGRRNDFVCINLKNKPPAGKGLLRTAATFGYDHAVPTQGLSYRWSADTIIAEMRKRMVT